MASPVTKDALLGLLAHEATRSALGRLAQGEDVRRVAADVAGQALAAKLGKLMGLAGGAVASPSEVGPEVKSNSSKGAHVGGGPNAGHNAPIDAEFVTINVTEEAKKTK